MFDYSFVVLVCWSLAQMYVSFFWNWGPHFHLHTFEEHVKPSQACSVPLQRSMSGLCNRWLYTDSETSTGDSPPPWHNCLRPLLCICCRSPSSSFCRLLSFQVVLFCCPPWNGMPNLHSSLVVHRLYPHTVGLVFCSPHLNQGRELYHVRHSAYWTKKVCSTTYPFIYKNKAWPKPWHVSVSPFTGWHVCPCFEEHVKPLQQVIVHGAGNVVRQSQSLTQRPPTSVVHWLS